ncbi:MAG: hypothetical protein M3367_10275 [Acidobacteriota bacterium]|nr:hypothetical protein [Acidobacteriota bacterium]
MKTREIRRHNAEKFKRRCQKRLRNGFTADSKGLANDPKFVGKLARTRQSCSCFMCGNPRKYFNEKTVGERRQEQTD